MGGPQRDRPVRPRGLRGDPPRVAQHLLPLVGDVRAGRRGRRGRRQGRRGQGGAVLHAADPDPQRLPDRAAAPRRRRPHRAPRARHRRPHRPPEHPAPLDPGRGAARGARHALRRRPRQPRRVRRRHAQRHRLPGGRRGRGRDPRRLAARARRDRDAQRQPGVLQPPAEVQGLDHRLPRRGARRRRSTTSR